MNRAYSRAGIISRMFNTPLAVTSQTAQIVLGAVGQRLDVSQLFVPTAGRSFSLGELEERAGAERSRIEARGGVDRRARALPAERLMFVHGGVAHVPVRGELVSENGIGPVSGFTGYDGIAASVQSADADPNVRGILLDIDSPGGEVSGLYECTRILMARRGTKPMRAIIRGMGCSAAYALAACADPGEITLHDLGYAGSVGTMAMHADFSGQLDQEGVKVTLFTAGEKKADGNPFEPLPESVARDIQAMVDIANTRFIAHVAEARGLSADAIIALQADIFRGETAVKAGLVDKVMSWQDSMDEFEAAVNAPGVARSSTAPTGARSARKENAMSTENPASAAEQQQPETSAIAIATATASARAEGVEVGAAAERTRIVSLAKIAGAAFSPALTEAIESGATAGDFAVAQADAKASVQSSAAAAAKGEAVAGSELPEGSSQAANPAAAPEANRGRSFAAKRSAVAAARS
jgi:ClpP class serine protease